MIDEEVAKHLKKHLAICTPKKKNDAIKMKIKGDCNFQAASNQSAHEMSINGNGNIQTAGDVTQHLHFHKSIEHPTITPPQNSIGADALLKNGIIARFNELGERREKRFGKSAYGVMYRNFKKSFGIKDGAWSAIWTWPVACAPAITKYLDEKLDSTIQGISEIAAKKGDYIHTRSHLFKLEREALEHLDADKNFVKNSLQLLFRASSHRDLTHLQQWQWVCYLEELVRQQYEES